MSHVAEWSIPGSNDEPILGDCHLPAGLPRGVVLVAHGFKGYKDYGMFPRIAQTLAGAGFIAHRFNFSHSGMTDAIETFERPDLFERDTWNKQVHDYGAVIGAVSRGELDGQGLPYVMFGHSRGGVTALLTAGRRAGDAALPQPAGVATAACPSSCSILSPEHAEALLTQGYLESPSARTGQKLRIGKAVLQEMRADPQGHDLAALVGRITCPILIVHGTRDPTVPAACADGIARAAGDRAQVQLVEGGDHVFNTPNPLPPDAEASPQLKQLLSALCRFSRSCCGQQAPSR